MHNITQQYLIFQNAIPANHPIEQVPSHVTINSGEGVVKEVDIRVTIHRTCQADTLLLTSTQVGTL